MGVRTRRRLLLAAILVLSGCAREALVHPEAVYQSTERLQRTGDLRRALEQAERARQLWRSRAPSLWYWKFNLLTAEILLFRGEVDRATALLQQSPPEGADRSWIEPRLFTDRAQVAFIRAHYTEASTLLERALALAMKSPDRRLLPEIELRRASLCIRQADFAGAERELHLAATAAAGQSDSYFEARLLGTHGLLLQNQSRFDEAVEWLQRSLALSRPAGYDIVTAPTLNNLAWCYFRLGDFDKATQHLTEAVALTARMQRPLDQQIALGTLGDIRYSLRDYKAAATYYERALAVSEPLHEDFWKAKWLNNLATTFLEMGDTAGAETYNRRALEIQTRRQDRQARLWPLLNAARIAAGRREYRRAEEAYREVLSSPLPDPTVLWEAHALLADLFVAAKETNKARLEFERANQAVEERRSRLRSDESKLTFYESLFEHCRRYVAFLMDHQHADQALAFAESSQARLLAEKMNSRSAPAVAPDFSGASRRLHAVLLAYWLGPERSFAWVVTPAARRAVPLPGEPEIRGLVDPYLAAIRDLRDPAAGGQPAARQLYSMLIAPVADLIPAGSRVILVPDGCLHRLNFETILTPSNHYWIEEVTLQIAPSLALLSTQPAPARGTPRSILLVGNPPAKDPDFPALPSAAQEIREISRLFPDPRVLQGGAATLQAYREADPGRFAIIHFAAHAVSNQSSSLDSAVILAPAAEDYKLYAREVKDSRLSADLVTVSACRSAGAKAYSGEGLVGFAWAFLSAGARHVVASLWEANDASTAGLMTDFYSRLRAGDTPAAALRSAKLRFIRSPDAQRKPYYWAAFQLYAR